MTDFIDQFLTEASRDYLPNVVIGLQEGLHQQSQAVVKVNQLSELSADADAGILQQGGFWYGTGDPNEMGADVSGVGASNPGVTVDGVEYALYLIQAGVLQFGATADGSGVHAVAGTLGAWTLDATSIAAASFKLDGSIPALLIGSATAYMTGAGIFAGLDGAAYKFRIGDPATKYLSWDGTNLVANGQWIASAGMNPALQEWKTNIVFSSASATQINWSSGTIRLSDGTTYSISAGNTGTMAALTYVYLDVALSATVLQITTTYSTAVGDGKVLVASAQNNATAASVIPFGGQQPVLDGAGQIAALSITAGSIAAGAITATKINVTSLSAITATMGALTVDNLLTMGGASSAITIGTTPPAGASSGTGIWIDRTGVYGLAGNVQQAIFDAATGAIKAGAGAVNLDEFGLWFPRGSDEERTAKWYEADDLTALFSNQLATIDGTANTNVLGITVRSDHAADPRHMLTIAVGYPNFPSIGISLDTGHASGTVFKTPNIRINEAANDVDTQIWGDLAVIAYFDAGLQSSTFEGAFTINDLGADVDTRVEGDTDANLFFVDASTDRVGIGTATPTTKLDVVGAAAISGGLTVTNGNVRSGTFSLNDDVATSFTPVQSTGSMLITLSSVAQEYGWIFYNTALPATVSYILGTGMVVLAGGGTLTNGTGDGTDTKFNVSCYTDGKIYLKNRLGSARPAIKILLL